ncbi:hypothetical protein [Corynebacterium pseudogenitalium]|uniref:Uncharacterized protein n=1 Tax=Corynebacterium pseudogenitalium ATCC 33035 TaxID=525264 RepID=E2S795_9CORY|nr:hypothetical protein [Corynebacterium pseudogenitalium]EFQ79383.1 hypothetical protein HMPREF0305_12397 [Corynebacterium pseudogenitalium ATCC 33035]
MDSYTLGLFIVAALLALIAVALSDPSDRHLAAGVGVVVSALFWTVPLVMLWWIGTPFSFIVFVIALSTVVMWALLADHALNQAFA